MWGLVYARARIRAVRIVEQRNIPLGSFQTNDLLWFYTTQGHLSFLLIIYYLNSAHELLWEFRKHVRAHFTHYILDRARQCWSISPVRQGQLSLETALAPRSRLLRLIGPLLVGFGFKP